MVLSISATNQRITGIQFTGWHARPDALINAGRAFAREEGPATLSALKSAQRKASADLAALQVELGYSYVTDGGFGARDEFIPYIEKLKGVEGGEGQISQQPGTRNGYFFIPKVTGVVSAPEGVLDEYLLTETLPVPAKKKLILVSPLSFALAAEAPSYSKKIELLYDIAEIQKKEIEKQSKNYQYVQFTESFARDSRYSSQVNRDIAAAYRDSLNRIFRGLPLRSAVYFCAGDAIDLIGYALESKVTDVGFDYNTYDDIDARIDKNLILGNQNINRKLPEDLLVREPETLAASVNERLGSLDVADDVEIFLAQSQGSHQLQTYPQAVRRDQNLSKALQLLRGESR